LIVILILLALGTILDAQAIIIIFSPTAYGLVVGCAVGKEKLLVVTKELLPFWVLQFFPHINYLYTRDSPLFT